MKIENLENIFKSSAVLARFPTQLNISKIRNRKLE